MGSYVRKQATVAAIVNVVVNPALAWLGNPEMRSVPVADMVRDVLITSVVLSLLVALFGARSVRHERDVQQEIRTDEPPWEGRLLARLPARAWALGLVLGLGAGLATSLAIWLVALLGLSGLSFAAFAAFKAVYTGALAFVVMRWVILRQLMKTAVAR